MQLKHAPSNINIGAFDQLQTPFRLPHRSPLFIQTNETIVCSREFLMKTSYCVTSHVLNSSVRSKLLCLLTLHTVQAKSQISRTTEENRYGKRMVA